MGARSRAWVIAGVFAVGAACGSDRASLATTPPPAVTTTPAALTTAATTAPTMATTAAITSAPAVVPAAWSETERDDVSSKAFPPCCADTWHGETSPALVATGVPLADGPYAVRMHWPDDLALPLDLELLRFEQCAVLPESSCEPLPTGMEYSPTDLGVDGSASREVTVALDERVRVVVVGWNDAAPDDRAVVEQANGTALGALATAVNQAYADVFAVRFAAGEIPGAIVDDVRAHPTGGFSSTVNTFGGITFTPPSGPPLLFQVAFPYVDGEPSAGRGTDVLSIRSLEVVGGEVTLFVYAAYYP